MTTLEKLFLQVFERKNGIIEQIKQQRDLYYKDLLSKSLIHGIPPPPWLWNYANSRSLLLDPKDLNKEELISELLFPHERLAIHYPTGQCSLYRELVKRDNGELLDELPKVIQDSNVGLVPVKELAAVPESHGNDVVHSSGNVVQLDSSVFHSQEDGVIPTVCVASGQTPGRCQGSQPVTAQNSGNLLEGSLLKSGSPEKCLDTISEQITRPVCVDIDPTCRSVCDPPSSPQDQTDLRISNIYKVLDQSLVRIHRSKSRQKALELRTSASAAHKSCLNHDHNTMSFNVMVDPQEPDHANELSKMVEFSNFNREGMAADVNGGNLSNGIFTINYSERTTRSRSTCKQSSSAAEPLKLDRSHELVRKDDDTNRESRVKRQAKGMEMGTGNGTGSYCGRITRSKSSCTHQIYKNDESLKHGRSSRIASEDGCTLAQPMVNNPQHLNEDSEGVVPFDVSDGTRKVREAATGNCVERKQGSGKYSGRITRSMKSGQNLSSANGYVALDMSFVSSKVDDGTLGQLTGNLDQHLDKANDILEGVDPLEEGNILTHTSNISLEKQSTRGKDAIRETQESWGPEANTEYYESERNRSRFNMNENPLVVNNYNKKDSEPFAFVHNSHAPHEPDVALSDVCKSDVDMHLLNCNLAGGSPDLQIKEGHLCSESWNKSEIIQPQSSGQSLITNLSKKFLKEEVNMVNPSDPVLDARTNFCCLDDDNSSLLEHKSDCENIGNLTCTTVTVLIEGNSKMFDSGFNTCGLVGNPHSKNEDSRFSKLRESQPTNKFPSPVTICSSTKADSWPQFKRRKVEDKQIICLSASPKFRVQNFHNIQKGYRSSYSRTAENNSISVLDIQVSPRSREGNANKISEMICQNMECHLTEGNVFSPGCQVQEGKLGFEEKITLVEAPSAFNHENSGSYLVSSLSKQITGDSLLTLVADDSTADPTGDVFAARSMCDEQDNQKFLHVENNDNPVDADALTSSETTMLESKSHLKVTSQLSSYSALSPCTNDLVFDRTLPVFESFVLNEQTETEGGGMDISEDGINFGELNHSSTSTQRVSVLEQLCRTAIRQTPLPPISSTFELLKTKDQYLSVQNGLREHVEMKSNLSLSDDSEYHLRDIFVEEVDSAFDKMSHSESLPYSDIRFGWNSTGSNSPPLGKLWERISSNSFSSEKRLSFNPELTCFPIEEDPSVSDEENADDLADNIENGICSTQINNGANREPLSDITEVGLYPPASVSVAEKFLHRGRFDSFNTEVFSTTFNSVKQRLRNSKGTNWQKDNQNLSVGANSIKKAGESLHNRFSKARLSGTTSMKGRGQRPSEKVKRNNIVSNVTSFIPLVQQKQAAAVCAVKRDVKVKALEAAEAARRLEEKKEYERKTKKEALKLERAKMEQENMRQKELDRKKKIEEMKKKAADVIARKRVRDAEERKEKERKKKRIEEGRRVHRAQEEKVRAGKGLKEKLGGKMGERMNDGKELDNRKLTDQDVEKENGNAISLNKAETEPKTKQASIVSEICDASSDCDRSRKSSNVSEHSAFGIEIANKSSEEKSYEISPYQCSDNEEDEEEELPTKKFVPSWASKNCVAIVLVSQQQIDPSVIFPRESFCTMDEVLLPRNIR